MYLRQLGISGVVSRDITAETLFSRLQTSVHIIVIRTADLHADLYGHSGAVAGVVGVVAAVATSVYLAGVAVRRVAR